MLATRLRYCPGAGWKELVRMGICCLAIALLIPVTTNAQVADLSGTWTGELHQSDKAWFFSMTLTLQQEHNRLTGIAKYIANDKSGAYVVQAIEGTLNGGKVVLNDLAVLEENNVGGTWGWSKKALTGLFASTGDSLFLNGDWVNDGKKFFFNQQVVESTRYAAAPGTFSVRRLSAAVPIPVKPAFAGSAPRLVSDTDLLLEAWDFDVVDDDSVIIKLNGRELGGKELLLARNRIDGSGALRFTASLDKGDNTLEITAKNEGVKPMNTLALQITADGRSQVYYFRLKTNEVATLHFVRE